MIWLVIIVVPLISQKKILLIHIGMYLVIMLVILWCRKYTKIVPHWTTFVNKILDEMKCLFQFFFSMISPFVESNNRKPNICALLNEWSVSVQSSVLNILLIKIKQLKKMKTDIRMRTLNGVVYNYEVYLVIENKYVNWKKINLGFPESTKYNNDIQIEMFICTGPLSRIVTDIVEIFRLRNIQNKSKTCRIKVDRKFFVDWMIKYIRFFYRLQAKSFIVSSWNFHRICCSILFCAGSNKGNEKRPLNTNIGKKDFI